MQIAFLSSRVPALGVYLVAPSLIAFIPAWTQATKLKIYLDFPQLQKISAKCITLSSVLRLRVAMIQTKMWLLQSTKQFIVKVLTIKLARTFTNSRRIYMHYTKI